ncbi:MAG: error-prone DNA polymerase [Bdellovibrionota bacterium]|nr:MAG: error-prone DNA polymerase [Bdellovibrionota bacterium]
MPDISYYKYKPPKPPDGIAKDDSAPPYVELQVTSNFSFLQAASHPEELIAQAAELGYHGIALTDHATLAGVVRAHTAAKHAGIPFYVGCQIQLQFDGPIPPKAGKPIITLLVYPQNRNGYGALCRLLTLGKRRAEGAHCSLTLLDFLAHVEDMAVVLVPPGIAHSAVRVTQNDDVNFVFAGRIIKEALPAEALLSIAITRNYSHNNTRRGHAIQLAADHLGLPLVAVNDVHYHHGSRRMLQDVVTCIRHGCSIEQAGYLLLPHAERCLKRPQELHRLFRDIPQAVHRTTEIAATLHFSLDELRYEYPHEICPEGVCATEYLRGLTWRGARERYPRGISEKVRMLICQELALIQELKYEKYFLTCYDIVRFANERGILCQGRGAAANSAVCFCLGITAVDPAKIDLLFARFVSKERAEPPDIDIDFEHERREEVIQYLYQKYGRHRAALVAEVISYRHRSAVRDVGKVFGLPVEVVNRLAKSIHRWTAYEISEIDLGDIGLQISDPVLQHTIMLSRELFGFPRHLSQHVGGFVISESPLQEIVPIRNAAMQERTIIEWDKDDVEELGMLKVDVLGLGMLSCIRKALAAVNAGREESLSMATIPAEDPKVYEMICRSDTVGVFQIESRAQMSMLPRLRPQNFYDLVIEVAIVRPGPIQGNMVHPFLRRRHGLEKPHFPDKRVEEILGKTLGVPIFQEQAMRLAIVLAQFTPGEAEQLRRAMAAWKRDKGLIQQFRERIIAGMKRNGYSEQFAHSCVEQIKGFSEYGFPESHAASFANLVYVSAWLKRYYPAHFAMALINSQPMGFYAPSQIVRDAEEHGVRVLPIQVGRSEWGCTIERDEEGKAGLRLGLCLVRGLGQGEGELIAEVSRSRARWSLDELWAAVRSAARVRGTTLRRSSFEAIARADGFAGYGFSMREALWVLHRLPKDLVPLDASLSCKEQIALPRSSLQQDMFSDYAATGLSLKAHPMQFYRQDLEWRGASTASALKGQGPDLAHSSMWRQRRKREDHVIVAGIAITRQRPGTAKGTLFITLEDETGYVNLVISAEVFERYSHILMTHTALLASGNLERLGEVLYVSVRHIESLDQLVIAEGARGVPNLSYSY